MLEYNSFYILEKQHQQYDTAKFQSKATARTICVNHVHRSLY